MTANGFCTTKAGSIWFVDWEENTTLKISSFHANSQINKFAVKHGNPSTF